MPKIEGEGRECHLDHCSSGLAHLCNGFFLCGFLYLCVTYYILNEGASSLIKAAPHTVESC